jgi:hypothetical protein
MKHEIEKLNSEWEMGDLTLDSLVTLDSLDPRFARFDVTLDSMTLDSFKIFAMFWGNSISVLLKRMLMTITFMFAWTCPSEKTSKPRKI